MRRTWRVGVAVSWWLVASVGVAQAQSQEQAQPGAVGQPSTTGTTSTTTTVMPYFPGGGITGLRPGPTGAPAPQGANDGPTQDKGTETQRGTPGGPIFTVNPRGSARGDVPLEHIVKRGDTLSTLADQYFHDGSLWPQIWALNPHIQNPNWLYPGDRMKLRDGTVAKPGAPATGLRKRTAPTTVFLRNDGFIEQQSDEDWGELVGSPRDNMFLGHHNETYLHIPGKHDVRIGLELTLFRHVRDVNKGKIIRILGTARVNAWDEEKRTARATIVESLDVVERGTRVGPLVRKIEIVPSVVADRDLKANVIATIYPLNFYAQNQVIFIDKGEADGLKSGNRLRIYRQGDAWRRSLVNKSAGKTIHHETVGLPEVDLIPEGLSNSKYPPERVGELRVIRVREHTSTCLVIEATLELDTGDVAWLRKGF